MSQWPVSGGRLRRSRTLSVDPATASLGLVLGESRTQSLPLPGQACGVPPWVIPEGSAKTLSENPQVTDERFLDRVSTILSVSGDLPIARLAGAATAKPAEAGIPLHTLRLSAGLPSKSAGISAWIGYPWGYIAKDRGPDQRAAIHGGWSPEARPGQFGPTPCGNRFREGRPMRRPAVRVSGLA